MRPPRLLPSATNPSQITPHISRSLHCQWLTDCRSCRNAGRPEPSHLRIYNCSMGVLTAQMAAASQPRPFVTGHLPLTDICPSWLRLRYLIALVSLYPSCYPWRNCYFGRKCFVVVIWFCADWQSVVMPLSLLWQRNSTLNLTTLFALVLRVLRHLLVLFSKLV